MKVKFNYVFDHAVEIGVSAGVRRAFKHSDTPDEQTIVSCVQDAVWESLYNFFDFDDEQE